MLDGPTSEKQSGANTFTNQTYDILGSVKTEVEKACPGVVSCSDLLQYAARDAVILVSLNSTLSEAHSCITLFLDYRLSFPSLHRRCMREKAVFQLVYLHLQLLPLVQTGGHGWAVPAGRRDGCYSNINDTITNLPAPTANLSHLIELFNSKGLTTQQLVVLSGTLFSKTIPTILTVFASSLQN